MVHLNNINTIAGTILMALITFFITPYIIIEVFKYRPLLSYGFEDSCKIAFYIGFHISLLIWSFYIKDYVKY